MSKTPSEEHFSSTQSELSSGGYSTPFKADCSKQSKQLNIVHNLAKDAIQQQEIISIRNQNQENQSTEQMDI